MRTSRQDAPVPLVPVDASSRGFRGTPLPMIALSFHPGAIVSVLAFGALFAFVLWHWSRQSIDPPAILGIKIALSTGLAAAAVWSILSLHPIIGVPLGAICGILIGILWARNIGNAMARPLADLYDGGTEQAEQKPFYAIAEAHRKQARYAEAIAEVEKQLERFPGDAQGLLMLAEIQARHLSDWEAAEASIGRIVSQEPLSVTTRARALIALADWHLDLKQDGPAAREVLARVQELFPGTAEAAEVEQRLAHLGDDRWRRERKEPSKIQVTPMDPSFGLRSRPGRGSEPTPPEPEPDPQFEADRLLAQLSEHPRDTEARELLAALYAERMDHPDWAIAQWELLVADAEQPPKQRARWLHRLADLHVRQTHDEDQARAALLRVSQLFPGTALAAKADSRLQHLRLEMRGQAQTLTVGQRPTSD